MNEINTTIQLDKLRFSCTSIVDDNFNDAVQRYPNLCFTDHTFNETILTVTTDLSRRYKYSYSVSHAGCTMGQIDFGLYGKSLTDERIRFTVDNSVFYNNTLCLLSNTLENLNLQIKDFTLLEIAIDNYIQNVEQTMRRSLKNKEYEVKLLGRIVRDRNKMLKEIDYWNSGSLNNPFKQRTLYIKNKKETFGLKAYNKKEEIKNNSPHKGYIWNYHHEKNPKAHNLFRTEIEILYDDLHRYQEKHKIITLEDLQNPQFLHSLFIKYFDRLIVIKDSNKQKIDLIPTPAM